MKFESLHTLLGSALVLLTAAPVDASLAHRQLHLLDKRHSLAHVHGGAKEQRAPVASAKVAKRGVCQFPGGDNVVAVTPDAQNAGWAMSPDQPCKPGMYCPYACASGMVGTQWDPSSDYSTSARMNGGLYCDHDGNIKKPFPNKPLCVAGTGAVKLVNKCNKLISACQTVLPGNEAMLIPTLIESISTLAVPDMSYWQSTAAHYYLNPPGVGSDGCRWGTDSSPIGNWAPYVAGANTVANGDTFVKIGYNPVWQSSSLGSQAPSYGLKIECPDGGCNGLPCMINPGGSVESNNGAVGAGGSAFCVVTVPKGKTAHIVAFDGSGGHAAPETPKPKETHQDKPTPTSAPPKSETPSAPATTAAAPSSSATEQSSSSSSQAASSAFGGIFHENSNSSTDASSTVAVVPSASHSAPAVVDKKNDAGRQQGSAAFVGLIVAVVATVCFF